LKEEEEEENKEEIKKKKKIMKKKIQIQKLSEIIKKEPSKNIIKYNMISIIYSYIYTIKVYNGDEEIYLEENLINSSNMIIMLSEVLSENKNFEDIRSLFINSMILARKPYIFQNEKFSIYTINDVNDIIKNKNFIKKCLFDLIILFKFSQNFLLNYDNENNIENNENNIENNENNENNIKNKENNENNENNENIENNIKNKENIENK
jgi:hypothetical protein